MTITTAEVIKYNSLLLKSEYYKQMQRSNQIAPRQKVVQQNNNKWQNTNLCLNIRAFKPSTETYDNSYKVYYVLKSAHVQYNTQADEHNKHFQVHHKRHLHML